MAARTEMDLSQEDLSEVMTSHLPRQSEYASIIYKAQDAGRLLGSDPVKATAENNAVWASLTDLMARCVARGMRLAKENGKAEGEVRSHSALNLLCQDSTQPLMLGVELASYRSGAVKWEFSLRGRNTNEHVLQCDFNELVSLILLGKTQRDAMPKATAHREGEAD